MNAAGLHMNAAGLHMTAAAAHVTCRASMRSLLSISPALMWVESAFWETNYTFRGTLGATWSHLVGWSITGLQAHACDLPALGGPNLVSPAPISNTLKAFMITTYHLLTLRKAALRPYSGLRLAKTSRRDSYMPQIIELQTLQLRLYFLSRKSLF
jgi:hypothetical protein